MGALRFSGSWNVRLSRSSKLSSNGSAGDARQESAEMSAGIPWGVAAVAYCRRHGICPPTRMTRTHTSRSVHRWRDGTSQAARLARLRFSEHVCVTLSVEFDMLGCLSFVYYYFLNRGLRTYETTDLGHPHRPPTHSWCFIWPHLAAKKYRTSSNNCPSIVLYST